MRLSVVIPFFNLERYVRSCIDSVVVAVARAGGDFELEMLCVDDGSSDGTPLLLDELASDVSHRFPTVGMRVLHKKNGGEGSARNAGLAAATGEWVTFLDGDDVWLPNHLETVLPILEKSRDADIIAFRYQPFDDGEALPSPGRGFTETVEHETSRSISDDVLLEVGVFPTFFKRTFLSGARFTGLPLGADRLFVAECLARAHRVILSSAIIHGYRIRPGSMARLAWTGRKVSSQCDYAFGSLRVLVASGKSLGRKGHAYLASLWLSDVPNRLSRLWGEDRRTAWQHWRNTLQAEDVVRNCPRFEISRRLLLAVGSSIGLSLGLARILRKGGVI